MQFLHPALWGYSPEGLTDLSKVCFSDMTDWLDMTWYTYTHRERKNDIPICTLKSQMPGSRMMIFKILYPQSTHHPAKLFLKTWNLGLQKLLPTLLPRFYQRKFGLGRLISLHAVSRDNCTNQWTTHFPEICHNILTDISISTHKQDKVFNWVLIPKPFQSMKNWPQHCSWCF